MPTAQANYSYYSNFFLFILFCASQLLYASRLKEKQNKTKENKKKQLFYSTFP